MKQLHLVPVGEDHDLDITCKCKPKVELIPHGARVTHNTKRIFTKYEIWSSNERDNTQDNV